MASAVAVVDYREFTKRALVAGFVTLVLASLLVGIEAVSTVSGLHVATRYRAVFCASIGVAIVYFLMEMLKDKQQTFEAASKRPTRDGAIDALIVNIIPELRFKKEA